MCKGNGLKCKWGRFLFSHRLGNLLCYAKNKCVVKIASSVDLELSAVEGSRCFYHKSLNKVRGEQNAFNLF